MLGNQGIRVNESLCSREVKSKIVKIEIDSTVLSLCFPEVEYLELNGLGGTSLPEIEVSNNVRIVKLNDFDDEKLCISNLFNSKDTRLPKLQEFEINNMPLKELYSNVLCNIFDYEPILRFNSEKMFFSQILSDQIICIEKNNLMSLFDSSSLVTEMVDTNPVAKTMIQKKLSISDEEIHKFANKWYVSYEDLKFFLNNYNYNLSLNDQNGFKDLKQNGNYKRYKQNGGEIPRFLRYLNQFSTDLQALIDHYSVEESNNQEKKNIIFT